MNSGDREFEGEDDGCESLGDGFSCHGRNVDEKEVSESELTEKMNLSFPSEAQNFKNRSLKVALVGGFNEVCDLEQTPKPIENTGEEWPQTTPEKPDDSEVKEKPSNVNAQNGVHKVYSGSKTNLVRFFQNFLCFQLFHIYQ